MLGLGLVLVLGLGLESIGKLAISHSLEVLRNSNVRSALGLGLELGLVKTLIIRLLVLIYGKLKVYKR